MEIKEQVLSIAQVRELQELGFVIKRYSTMTIGDIINILPVKIEESYFLSVNSEYCEYSMVGGFDTIFFTREKELIDNLFKTLIWCIKNKHIEL